jgi:photosystem II stability/assembly factor-like uncharacterized protein
MLLARRRNPILLATCFVAALFAGCSRPAPEPWQEVRLSTDARFNGVWFTDSLNGWLAGGARDVPGGLLGRTRDGGRTWQVRSDAVPGTGDGFHLGGIQFRDSLNGCLVGGGGLVLLTADGGVNWRRVRRGRSPTDHMSRLQLLGDRAGWALGPATLIATHDGGETWKELVRNREETGYLSGRAIAFVNAWRGFLVSHGGILMRTEDGGLSWSPVPLPFPHDMRPTLNDITFADHSHGWFVGERGTIGHTSDGGETWELQANGVPVERVLAKGEKPRPPDIIPGLDDGPSRLELTAVRFADPLRGFALGHYADVGESVILGTRDGGATWTTERVAPGQYLHTLFVLDRRHAWAAGDRTRQLPQLLYRYTGLE